MFVILPLITHNKNHFISLLEKRPEDNAKEKKNRKCFVFHWNFIGFLNGALCCPDYLMKSRVMVFNRISFSFKRHYSNISNNNNRNNVSNNINNNNKRSRFYIIMLLWWQLWIWWHFGKVNKNSVFNKQLDCIMNLGCKKISNFSNKIQ
jgi:hypothetical protein